MDVELLSIRSMLGCMRAPRCMASFNGTVPNSKMSTLQATAQRRFEPDARMLALPALDNLALFFDVDGTLLEIRPDPLDVVADAPLRKLMSALAARCCGALALVSGRSLQDIDRIFAPLKLVAAGLHGAEVRFPDNVERRTNPHIMDHARPQISRYVADHEGLMLEDKGATLAVHYRNRPDLGADVLKFLLTFTPGDEIAVQEGKFVVELKPALYDKGTAIASLLATAPFKGRVPLFIGDDLTDESGFAFVNSAGGISVRIGSPEVATKAQHLVPDPAALRSLLSDLAGERLP